MRKIGIVVDGLVNLNFKKFIFKDAGVIPLSFLMGANLIKEGTRSNEELFELSKINDFQLITPKTEEIINIFNNQKLLGYENIIYLASSKYFSNVYQQAHLAKEVLLDDDIHIIDTKTFGPGIEYLLEMIHAYENKFSFDELVKKINEVIEKIEIIIDTDHFNQKTFDKVMNLATFSKNIVVFKDEFKKIKSIKIKDINNFYTSYINKDLNIGIIPYVKSMSASSFKDAKIFHHELYTVSKEVNLTNYGEFPFIVSRYIGLNARGILYGVYGGL